MAYGILAMAIGDVPAAASLYTAHIVDIYSAALSARD